MVSPFDPNKLYKEKDNETNLAVSIAAGIGSGLIKVPVGLASVAAEVYGEAGVKVLRLTRCRKMKNL